MAAGFTLAPLDRVTVSAGREGVTVFVLIRDEEEELVTALAVITTTVLFAECDGLALEHTFRSVIRSISALL